MSDQEDLAALRDNMIKHPSPLFMPRSKAKFPFITVKRYDFDTDYTIVKRVCEEMRGHGLHPDRIEDFRRAVQGKEVTHEELEKWVHLDYSGT